MDTEQQQSYATGISVSLHLLFFYFSIVLLLLSSIPQSQGKRVNLKMEIFFHSTVLLSTLPLMSNKGYATKEELFFYHINIWYLCKMLLCRYIFESPNRYFLRLVFLPWDRHFAYIQCKTWVTTEVHKVGVREWI